MYRKIIICVAFCIGFINLPSLAGEPNEYIIPARAKLFDGTVSGVRQAYQIFEDALMSGQCPECETDREFTFFHCLADTAMLLVKDDGNSIDSIFELAKNYGINIQGDKWAPYFEPNTIDINEVTNQRNTYEIPQNALSLNDVKNIIDSSFLSEIEEIISDLNSISDTPGDRFRIYLSADELRILYPADYEFEEPLEPVEVDYGEVLLLKGLLTDIKVMIEMKNAYDIYTDPNNRLFEKYYGEALKFNEDILQVYPYLLKVLPTVHDSNDGAAILAQAAQDSINALNHYLEMIEYMRNEEDWQGDDFLYIDPNDNFAVNQLEGKLETLRDSRINDIAAIVAVKTIKTYSLQDACSTPWTLILNFDVLGSSQGQKLGFTTPDENKPGNWDVTYFEISHGVLTIEMERQISWWPSESALLTAIISADQNMITNGIFEFWGHSGNGMIDGFTSFIVNIENQTGQINLNPIFGSTTTYPNPVNPRDLLPEYDQWNKALPGTVGHGLGDDPNLGGITSATQKEWQIKNDLQPSGLVNLDFINSEKIIDGNLNDWDVNQLIFNDITGDTDPNSDVSGVDIKNLYLARDSQYLYGAIETYDNIGSNGEYEVFLSYSPDNENAFHSLNIKISNYGSSVYGTLDYLENRYGWTGWQYITTITCAKGQNGIEFQIPFDDIPDYLPGRYITVNSSGQSPDWTSSNGEENNTRIQLGEVGSISGTVAYNSFEGDPIFVQAYTDPEEPEESTVATVMITQPGPYTLEGIGLGWEGYIRAFTPVFGFDNPFEISAFQVQTATQFSMTLDDPNNINITMNYPIELKKDIVRDGQIDADTREVDWYYFDAVESGTYTISLTPGTAQYAGIAIYDRNARWELEAVDDPWETQEIIWSCPASGKYFVEVKNKYYEPAGGTYQIQMTSDITCPQTDIANMQWVGVKDCKVNFYDFAAFASRWLNTCSEPFWCQDADFDASGSVNFSDFATLADEWLEEGI